MKRIKVAVAATALLAAAATIVGVVPASAEFTPQTKDIVGTGSDTTELVENYVADGFKVGPVLRSGYNANADARLVSFNATNPVTGLTGAADPIVLKVGTAAVSRPNGSGGGKSLLYGSGNNTNANFARSSGVNSSAETTAGLWMFPFAADDIAVASSAAGTNAPASLTKAQLVGIYTGVYTTWNQVGGTGTATIKPLIPQANSGTRVTFMDDLGLTDADLVGVTQVQENDQTPYLTDPNAIGPFSVGRANTVSPAVHLLGGYSKTRALYNVVRAGDLSASFVASLFGPTGFFCSSGAASLISAGGFHQLASSPTGVCGVPTQSAPTNLATNN